LKTLPLIASHLTSTLAPFDSEENLHREMFHSQSCFQIQWISQNQFKPRNNGSNLIDSCLQSRQTKQIQVKKGEIAKLTGRKRLRIL